jgi:molecular chaperone GrpE
MTKNNTKNNKAEEQKIEAEVKEEQSQPTENSEQTTSQETVEEKQPEMTLEEQVKDLEDRNLRLLAEMQNMRVRHQKDLKDTREFAVSGFANDMIALSEDIYRARDAIPNAEDELYKKILQGLDITIEELKRFLLNTELNV